MELSAAYDVLKNKDKRAQYDAERRYGFGGSSSSSSGPYSSSYGRSSSAGSQQAGYNPYRRGGGGNPYANQNYHNQEQSADEFMKWYRSQFGDVFREFEDYNRGDTAIIEERMPDGSIRIRIVRMDPRAGPGHARARQQRPNPDFNYQAQQQQQQQRAQAQEMFNSIFSGGGMAGGFFKRLFGMDFDTFGGGQEYSNGSQGNNGIPFGSGYIDYPSLRLQELHGQLAFSVMAGNRHVGTMSHRMLSNGQGDVLTCNSGSSVLAKARHYLKEGKERVLIENGESKRVASIEALKSVPEVVSEVTQRKAAVAIFASIKNATSLHYQIFDDAERPSGYMSVSPFRRKIIFYDTQGIVAGQAERKDIEQEDLKMPTRDDWLLGISDTRLVDSSLYVFAAAFSTLKARRSTSLLADGGVLTTALANLFKS